MADDADMAQVSTEQLLDAKIASCRSSAQSGSGSVECVDCDEPIPAARKEAVPGCVRCIDCQDEFEEEGGIL
ncbi:MAG: TraR/DksA family transcriptional regulator [Deltaproteobacteria bacterium]|nr:TraR/DksA family transcriptional regulator [Deltaproteobacteria bacterium]